MTEFQGKPATRNLRRPLVVNLQHSSGESIDFVIEQRGGKRVLSMIKRSGDARTSGPVLRLRALTACAGSVSMEKVMRMYYGGELVSNNPERTAGYLFSLLSDRETWRLCGRLATLFTGSFLKRKSASNNKTT